MRSLTHLLLSPASRLARLMLGEKRLAYDPVAPEDSHAHLPVFVDLDGTHCEGLWALVDHLEGAYPEHPLIPEDDAVRADTLRLLDWAMGPFHETVTRRIVFEKGGQRHTGALVQRADRHGYLAARECTLGDLALAAHLSALDYFGEVPWKDFSSAAEWYLRVKSRPGFRLLLSDRVPGQPPVSHYAELDD